MFSIKTGQLYESKCSRVRCCDATSILKSSPPVLYFWLECIIRRPCKNTQTHYSWKLFGNRPAIAYHKLCFKKENYLYSLAFPKLIPSRNSLLNSVFILISSLNHINFACQTLYIYIFNFKIGLDVITKLVECDLWGRSFFFLKKNHINIFNYELAYELW